MNKKFLIVAMIVALVIGLAACDPIPAGPSSSIVGSEWILDVMTADDPSADVAKITFVSESQLTMMNLDYDVTWEGDKAIASISGQTIFEFTINGNTAVFTTSGVSTNYKRIN